MFWVSQCLLDFVPQSKHACAAEEAFWPSSFPRCFTSLSLLEQALAVSGLVINWSTNSVNSIKQEDYRLNSSHGLLNPWEPDSGPQLRGMRWTSFSCPRRVCDMWSRFSTQWALLSCSPTPRESRRERKKRRRKSVGGAVIGGSDWGWGWSKGRGRKELEDGRRGAGRGERGEEREKEREEEKEERKERKSGGKKPRVPF